MHGAFIGEQGPEEAARVGAVNKTWGLGEGANGEVTGEMGQVNRLLVRVSRPPGAHPGEVSACPGAGGAPGIASSGFCGPYGGRRMRWWRGQSHLPAAPFTL